SAHTVLKKLDEALQAENDLYDSIYESSINHTVRRLITLALLLYGEYGNEEVLFLRKLRLSIETNFKFPVLETERIITLLDECARISGKRYPSGRPTTVFNKASKGADPRCYICGK